MQKRSIFSERCPIIFSCPSAQNSDTFHILIITKNTPLARGVFCPDLCREADSGRLCSLFCFVPLIRHSISAKATITFLRMSFHTCQSRERDPAYAGKVLSSYKLLRAQLRRAIPTHILRPRSERFSN